MHHLSTLGYRYTRMFRFRMRCVIRVSLGPTSEITFITI
jgi:hypothetical protein